MSIWRYTAAACMAAACLWGLPGAAAPGAHGPDGEHLDAPGAVQGVGRPTLEAATEAFELVAQLTETELSVLVDHFASNEPVLGARLEVEVGGLKATATFHADHGDYAVDDPAVLRLLQAGGEHAVVFTVIAGDQSDLLEGTLRVPVPHAHPSANADAAHGHTHLSWRWVAAAMMGLALLAAAFWFWRRRRAQTVGRLGL
jgi:hypothetical protein